MTPEDAFKLHAKIRWAGLASEYGEVFFSKQRDGVKRISPEDADHAFMQMGPLLLVSICERLSQWTGEVGSIVVNYEKVDCLIVKVRDGYLALALEKGQPAETISQVVRALKK